jgi:hypothetical protein
MVKCLSEDDVTAKDRAKELSKAPKNSWVAFSEDESRVIAYGESFQEVVSKAEAVGETDPLILKTPEDWTHRVL